MSLSHDTKPILSSRPEAVRRDRSTPDGKLAAMTLRSQTERMQTDTEADQKEEKIKDCIEMMTEVLTTIR